MVAIPNIRSAKKRLRQSLTHHAHNLSRKAVLRRIVKEIRARLTAGEKDEAKALLPRLAKAADKAAQRNAIAKNRAARIKSRWMKKVESA